MSSKVNMAWTREQGPLTRGKHRQSRPYTRNMRRLAIHRKLKFMCGCCADSENPVNRVRTSTTGDSKCNLCLVGKFRYKKRKNIDGPKEHLAHKIKRGNRKSCKARVARGRSGQDSLKRDVSASKQAQGQASAAVCAGNSKLTRFGECNHPIPFAFATSSSVKGVAAFGCHTCDCTYSECTPNGQNTVDKLQQDGKVILWDDSFPRVSLCDISPLCVECQHKCTFVLPDNVTSKHCFKEEMRAGFRFEPGCLSQKKQSFHETVQVRNNGQPSQLTYVNDQNKDVTNNADSGSLVNHVPQNHKSCEITCSAEQRPNKLCMMQNKCTDSRQNILRNESLVNIENGILSEDSNTQNGDCMDSPLNNDGFSDALGSVYCVDSPKRTAEQQLRPNVFALNKTDELASFTCQRVRVYSGKNSSSCARAYLTWPLLLRKLSSTEQSESAGHPSSFQISQHFEPADPDQPPIPELSISNQGAGANIKENTSNCVDASSNLLNKNRDCPLYSTQQRLTMPDILDTFCKSLASSSSQRPAPLQIKGSSSVMIDSSRSTPSPSTLGLTETSPNIFATTLLDTSEVLNSVSSSPPFLTTPASNVCCVDQSQTACSVSLDLNDSYDSSSLLPQDMEVSCDETATRRSPPILEPYFKTSQFICNLTTTYGNDSLMSIEKCRDGDLLLPPLLSPLNSPLKHIVTNTSVDYEHHNSDMPKPKMRSENDTPEITNVIENGHAQNCSRSQIEAFPSHNDVHRFVVPAEEESQQQPLVTDSTAQSPPSIASTQSSFSPSSNNDESSDQDSNCSEMSENQEPEEDLESPEVLDEVEAYEHDILLVDVFQDDSDLFEKLPLKGLLKLGPVRTSDNPEPGCKKMVKIMPPTSESSKITQRSSITPVNLDFLRDSPEDSPRRSWRPQCNSTSSALQCGSIKQHKLMVSSEENRMNTEQERTVHFPTENISHISPSLASRLGFITRNPSTPNEADIRWQKPAYCRNYFSESLNCGFKACRFHHVPMDGDEKFCTETLARFVKNPACLHKAGAVFTGFYQSNKPGVYFSKPVLTTLQWALLKAGMLSDLFSVFRTALAHTIVPELEFLLGVFNFIREKCLLSFAPELMQLTLKMAGAGLPLSLDFLDSVKNTELHQTVSSNYTTVLSGNTRSTPTEYLNLAHAVVEMELCTKQEDWKRLGKVFQSICQSTQQVNLVERISGRFAVALLSESKDRLMLPFAAFAETAAHNVDDDSPVMSCLGRIGVSLMLRYHKTHQWVKGLKVVEVLSAAKVSYATMKGLFGNEDGTSRCHLVNVATELFLLNNSVEGALNTLRENEWFLTSSVWPCEAADIENRTHVLLRLAEMTSHRDTLEILSNLPGLKEPNGHVDIARYTTFFSAHLQVCLDRQIVALASDLVDFMLSKGLQVDHAMLQMLLHKLGKQNLWLRARAIFKHSLNKGYYPGVSAPHAMMTLMVPSQLGEIELALTFEMFITMNASAILALPECTTSTMSITLKRTQSGESDYLSAGSRLLSAACIPQPKLSVRYTSVNSSQDQVFALDISSARRWLRNNHLWANEVWTIST